jgi:putative NAD(P)-binding protein
VKTVPRRHHIEYTQRGRPGMDVDRLSIKCLNVRVIDGNRGGQQGKNVVNISRTQKISDDGAVEPTAVDIAIIGAGAAGLYVAWRLLAEPAYQKKSIALFDAADRLGGRILSVTVPEVPYVAELGAMRYLPEQILTRSHIEDRFQLEHLDFGFETRGYFLRGKYVSQKAVALGKKSSPPQNVFPYDVDETETGKTPIELIVLSIQRALRVLDMANVESRQEARCVSVATFRRKLRDLDQNTLLSNLVERFTGKEWRLIKRYGRIDGRRLYDVGFWDLIRRFLSQEGYNLAYDGSGGFQHLKAADAMGLVFVGFHRLTIPNSSWRNGSACEQTQRGNYRSSHLTPGGA